MRIRVGLWSLLIVGAACGGSSSPMGSTGPGGNPQPAGPVVDVSMTDNNGQAPYAFSQATLNIKVGTSVRWTNTGKAQHTATSDPTSQAVWNRGTVQPAGTTTCAPTDYSCTPGTTPAGTYVSPPFNTAGMYQYH